MLICPRCGKENTPNHHFETEINSILKTLREKRISSPIFKVRGLDARLLGCHVNQDDSMHIHAELYWNGSVYDEENCSPINEKRAEYILKRLKKRLLEVEK